MLGLSIDKEPLFLDLAFVSCEYGPFLKKADLHFENRWAPTKITKQAVGSSIDRNRQPGRGK